ncbi:MAG: S8 family peptidase [Burkholderiales bacterium]
MPALDHLFVSGFTESTAFKSTLSVKKQPPPQRDRQAHGARLLAQIGQLKISMAQIEARREELGLPQHTGVAIALEISPRGALDYAKQLEWRRDGIEVLSAVTNGDNEIVVLHVPEGKLTAFEKRVNEYLTKDVQREGQPAKPKNATLINAIASIRRAAFDELWTDAAAPPPPEEPRWFQVWLRVVTDAVTAQQAFVAAAQQFNIEVEAGYVRFPGRVVVAARASRANLEAALELLDLIAEIRHVDTTADFFLTQLKPFEQVAWIEELIERSTFPDAAADVPHVTVMDTGVNHGHPLLSPSLAVPDLHVIDPAWGTHDDEGHGTQMAGVACHGDLTALLDSEADHPVPHRLESVKLLPPEGHNPPHLYGAVTIAATELVEAAAPARRRTFVMAATAEGHTAGIPSEWSATVDQLAFDQREPKVETADAMPEDTTANARLIVLAAGNVPWTQWGDYPSVNDTSSIENPAQAWNALTVGACTHLTLVDAAKWPGLARLAGEGALSPSSKTSLLWPRAWPFKPDVVAEGGNGCLDKGAAVEVVVGPESLRVLTTWHELTQTPLSDFGDTSAAAAEVARQCAHIQARYPTYWPESVRGLVVHAARYTPAMRATLSLVPTKEEKRNLLRRYGYGRATLEWSLSSSEQHPTLVLQEFITPYLKNGGTNALGNMNMHALPWPAEQLQALGATEVALRVTLSYFIEPNPARRGWQSKFRYQSHGLRFAVKGSTETDTRFRQRINKIEREELDASEQEEMTDPDAARWFFGAQMRSRGSIHSDVWFGNAARLAAKSHIAVFPVGGWWKDWKDAGADLTPVKYALIVSLEVLDDIDVDIYTPIAASIGVPVVVQ